MTMLRINEQMIDQRNAETNAAQTRIDRQHKKREKHARHKREAEQFERRQQIISGLGSSTTEWKAPT